MVSDNKQNLFLLLAPDIESIKYGLRNAHTVYIVAFNPLCLTYVVKQ